jgi:iron complex transport system substrate-binding protein
MKFVFLVILLFAGGAVNASEQINATDDHGNALTLTEHARRIISLAPHITELLFAAGAGDRIVGTVDYSDFPPAAKSIPRIGNYGEINLEALLALKPDLVIAWGSGSPTMQMRQLRELGVPVYVTEPRRLADIAGHIEKLGRLTGTEDKAIRAATAFRKRLQALHKTYASRREIDVFYAIWPTPLTTVNGQHLISKVINLCGGHNVFADLASLAPQINIEALLVRNPDVIIASGAGLAKPQWLNAWRHYPELKAVRAEHLYFIDPDLLQRHTPRILEGAEIMCEQLARVRDSMCP